MTEYLNILSFLCMILQHCVTYDGEHENEYGTQIVADLMARTLFDWIEESDISRDLRMMK